MDVDTFWWLLLPLVATVAAAVYQARKDAGLAERVGNLEKTEAARQGAESVTSVDQGSDGLAMIAMQVAANSQAIGGLSERMKVLES